MLFLCYYQINKRAILFITLAHCLTNENQLNIKKLPFIIVATLFSFTVFAQADVRARTFNLQYGLAILGCYPVAYFTSNTAVEGKKNFLCF